MCVGVIARNEETQPCIPTLPNNVQDKVVTLLALDLDLEQAGTVRFPHIPSGFFHYFASEAKHALFHARSKPMRVESREFLGPYLSNLSRF